MRWWGLAMVLGGVGCGVGGYWGTGGTLGGALEDCSYVLRASG